MMGQGETTQPPEPLVEFLRARLADDERRARSWGPWDVRGVRVLVECGVRARVLELHLRHVDPPCATLRILAQRYHDHPDYGTTGLG